MTTTETLTLPAFLTARLDEDEAAARFHPDVDRIDFAPTGLPVTGLAPIDTDQGLWYLATDPARVLAEVEANRRIVAMWEASQIKGGLIERVVMPSVATALEEALRALASVYAGHDDYRVEWAL